jgi:very-short-patch-repair endonuclease
MAADDRLHVSATSGRAAPRTHGVAGHALTAGDVATTICRGVPVVAAADTWCHLAASLSREDLAAAGDYLISGRRMRVGREAPLCSLEDLSAAVAKNSGRRGSRALQWALPRLRTGVDSRPESLLRLLLVAAKLPEPRVNDPTLVDDGRRTLHPDLKYERWRVVFEYEGDGHRTDKRQFRRDIVRRELFEAAEWRVIRVMSDDLHDPQAFLARVRRILRDREAYLAVLGSGDPTRASRLTRASRRARP